MKLTTFTILTLAALIISTRPTLAQQQVEDRLDEVRPISLFNGENLDGWTTQDGKPITKGWEIEDGQLVRKSRGGTIYTQHEYGDFDLRFEWKIAKGGNSGVKYRVNFYPIGVRKRPGWLGCEYQVYGDRKPDDFGTHSAGALYDLFPPGENKQLRPVDEFNESRIVARGTKIEHWLNGEKLVDVDTSSPTWNERISKSKFGVVPDFFKRPRGRIQFQDHGSEVTFRNMTIRVLDEGPFPFVMPKMPVESAGKPNILFFFVDDFGKYASIYADPKKPSLNDVIKTPHFDRIGREGVVFNNAFVPVASCGPCRAALATGQYFWKCGSGAFLNGKASDWKGHENPFPKHPKFVDLLRNNGYFVRKSQKTFAFEPSPLSKAARKIKTVPYFRYGLHVGEAKNEAERKQRHRETLEHPRIEMRRVLQNGGDQPFFFAYGTINVHRPYTPDSGQKLWGINPDDLKGLIPEFLPDEHDVRRDFADYLGEVMAADAMLGAMLDELEKAGKLNDTLVIVSGDHGVPGIPRGKTNCYDLATRVPLLARWPKKIPRGRRVEDFVSVMDIGPTLLKLTGTKIPDVMDGTSFASQLTTRKSGWVNSKRNEVIIGRELHYHTARDGNLPYPMRAIRTRDFLYVKNFKPERWPMGAPYNIDNLEVAADYQRLSDGPYRDIDASLTKTYLLSHREETDARQSIEMTLGKRPAEELYRLRNDPHQMNNLAGNPDYQKVQSELSSKLMGVLRKSNDPRLSDAFDKPPYVIPPGKSE